MKIKIATGLILFLTWGSLYAQQRPQFSQYVTNTFLFNPATTGALLFTDARAGYRNQWTGIEGAPQTFFASLNWSFYKPSIRSLPTIGTTVDQQGDYGENVSINRKGIRIFRKEIPVRVGAGALAMYEEIGARSRLMFYLSGAAHVPLDGKGLEFSLGIRGGIIQDKIDAGALNPQNQGVPDAAIDAQGDATINPDLEVGILVHNKRFYGGLSAGQLIGGDINSARPAQTHVPHYYAMGGYSVVKSSFKSLFNVVLSGLVRYVETEPIAAELHTRVILQNFLRRDRAFVWAGVGYRFQDTGTFSLGIQYRRYDLNYSFDTNFGNPIDGSLAVSRLPFSGTHEITFGYRIGRTRVYRDRNFLEYRFF